MVDAGVYPGYPPEPDLRPYHYHPAVAAPQSTVSSNSYSSYSVPPARQPRPPLPSMTMPVPPIHSHASGIGGHAGNAHSPVQRNLPPIPVSAPSNNNTHTPPAHAHAPAHVAQQQPQQQQQTQPSHSQPQPHYTPPAPEVAVTPPTPVPIPGAQAHAQPQSAYRQQSSETTATHYGSPPSDVSILSNRYTTVEPASILQNGHQQQPVTQRPQPHLPRAAYQPPSQPQQSVQVQLPQPQPPAPQAGAAQQSTPPPSQPQPQPNGIHLPQPPPPAPSTQVSFSESTTSATDPPRSSLSSAPADSPAITQANGSPASAPRARGSARDGVVAKPWVHDSSRVYFLPPATNGSSPPALNLIHDSLEAVKDYREFVDTIGRLEYEFGKSLAQAIKKFDQKLDNVTTPPPGGKKPPVPSLVSAMRRHLEQLNTQASLHQKRPGALGSQLVAPLHNLEKRGGESARRLQAWSKEVRTRWEAGRERVESARAKYHTAVREDETAQQKLRACPPPSEGTKESEWVKIERAAAEAEANRAERKRAYLVAIAGEGDDGGGQWDRSEGGGIAGWGEEARQLYGHIEASMLELLRHHAHEDIAHIEMLATVLKRGEHCYDKVSIAADQNAFLEWNDTGRPTEHIPEGGVHSSLRSFIFIPPPSNKNEEPKLGTEKQADRNWLVNKWLQCNQALLEVEGDPEISKGPLDSRRKQLATVRKECVRYATNRGLGDADEAWERRLALLREIGVEERKAAVLHAEMRCLESVLGPSPAPELGHDFKERQFAAPQPCDVCGQAVWSPLKSELSCRLCTIALHVKCALFVDPECTGLKSTRRRTFQPHGNRIRRSITTSAFKLRRHSAEAPHGAPQAMTPVQPKLEPLRDDEVMVSPFVSVPATEEAAVREALVEEPKVTLARVRFDYAGESEADLRVLEGEVVRLLEPDLDGSGWVKARRGLDKGQEGLVPVAYVGIAGQSTPPLDGGSGRFVHALFDFPPPTHHLGPGEVAVKQHQIYELSQEGMAFDQLWAELLVPHPAAGTRIKGVVPKTYIKPI